MWKTEGTEVFSSPFARSRAARGEEIPRRQIRVGGDDRRKEQSAAARWRCGWWWEVFVGRCDDGGRWQRDMHHIRCASQSSDPTSYGAKPATALHHLAQYSRCAGGPCHLQLCEHVRVSSILPPPIQSQPPCHTGAFDSGSLKYQLIRLQIDNSTNTTFQSKGNTTGLVPTTPHANTSTIIR